MLEQKRGSHGIRSFMDLAIIILACSGLTQVLTFAFTCSGTNSVNINLATQPESVIVRSPLPDCVRHPVAAAPGAVV